MRVIQIGLGPIGQGTARLLLQRSGVQLVAAVDLDPAKVGKDVGELVGLEFRGIAVTASSRQALALDADAVVLTTSSRLRDVRDTLLECAVAGKSVVSTCEELVYPWRIHPELARDIDESAHRNGVAILGTGVNPGFVMDALPLFMTGVCSSVRRIRIERFQNAALRRLPFQNKVGAGLTLAEFERKRAAQLIGHVGFTESTHMLADALGWELDRIEHSLDPVQDRANAGDRVIGIRQTCCGFRAGESVIDLELQAYLGHPDPRDRVQIFGTPDLTWNVPGGVDGDIATCALAVNAIPTVLKAPPGLRTMRDLPLISCGVATAEPITL